MRLNSIVLRRRVANLRVAIVVLALGAASTSAVLPRAIEGQEAARSPHGTLPEGLGCLDCHSTEAWAPLADEPAFDHDDYGDFPLDGRHADVTCASCHQGLVFDRITGDRDDCAGCHVDVHQGTIARPCSACHTTESFAELDFGLVHPADFPLEGAHLQTSCESCHTDDLGGAFAPLDRECASCHLDDYLSAPLIDHEALGFSTDCTECHSALDFRDVLFDHFTLSGGFELIGAHSAIECTSCHSLPGGGLPVVPAGPDDCIACHLADYQDEHGGSDFPTDCLACHRDTSWDGATFDHTFQIFNGPHAGEWSGCEVCHFVPGDFAVFSCFDCHGEADMWDKHKEENGYAYDSPTCLFCHPTGRKD